MRGFVAIKGEKIDERPSCIPRRVNAPPFEALEWKEVEEKEEENEKGRRYCYFQLHRQLSRCNTVFSASSEVVKAGANASNECME